MGVKIRKHGTVTAQFATAQQVDISHANDSISIGDGTNVMGPLQNVGGVLCFPVSVESIDSTGLALDATLTGGTQKTKISDGVDPGVVEIDDVGGEKALKVSVISSVGGSAAPAHVDDAAFTVGTSSLTPIGALLDDTGTDSVDEGDVGVLRMTADRLLKIQIAGILAGLAIPITDNSGNISIDDGGNSITVDGTVTVQDGGSTISIDDGAGSITVDGTVAATQSGTWNVNNVSGTVSLPTGAATAANQSTEITALQLIDDIVFTDDAGFTPGTSKGAVIMAQADETSPDSVDEGDAGALRMTLDRLLKIQIAGVASGVAVPITDNSSTISIDDGAGSITIDGSVTATGVAGAAAHDAGVSGNPVRVAGRAMLANGTAVAEDDTADIATDNQGRVITTPHVPRDLVTHATGSQSTTTEATILAAGGANVFLDVTKLILSNSSTSSSAQVQIRDATTGTIRLEIIIAANGGAVIDFGDVPMCQTTANNNWTIDLNAAVSTVYWYIQAIKRIA